MFSVLLWLSSVNVENMEDVTGGVASDLVSQMLREAMEHDLNLGLGDSTRSFSLNLFISLSLSLSLSLLCMRSSFQFFMLAFVHT